MESQEGHNPALEWRGKSARPIATSPSSPSPVFRIQSIYSQIYFFDKRSRQSCASMHISHVRQTEDRRNV